MTKKKLKADAVAGSILSLEQFCRVLFPQVAAENLDEGVSVMKRIKVHFAWKYGKTFHFNYGCHSLRKAKERYTYPLRCALGYLTCCKFCKEDLKSFIRVEVIEGRFARAAVDRGVARPGE